MAAPAGPASDAVPVVGGSVRWWARRRHRLFSSDSRSIVHTILLISRRLQATGTTPVLPPELWEIVISLLPVTPARFVVETVAGVPQRGGASDGPLAVAQFFVPTGLAVDPTSGSIYVADSNNHKVRVINCSTGTVTTFAGSQDFGFTDGPAHDARFQNPHDVAMATDGGVLVTDSENGAVRHISQEGMVSTLGSLNEPDEVLYRPQGMAVARNGDVLVADTLNHRIARVRWPTGELSTVAQAKRWEAEPMLGASFGMPTSVAMLPSSNYIVTAGATNRLWEVSSEGDITKVVGDGPGLLFDVCRHFQDGPGATAKFWHPCGVCVDGVGNVFVADTNNNCVRLIRPSQGWVCTKIAGTIDRGYRDGAAEQAQFFRPVGLALDRDGSILVADTDNHVVRRVRCCLYTFAS